MYRPGSVLAQKHNLPTTPPGKKRHADRMYRELGIFSGKKPESSSIYRGTDDNGSPNAASAPPHLPQHDDDDECMPSDSQLRNASKALFPASYQAAPNPPATQLHVASAQLHQSDSAIPASQPHGGPREATPKLSQLDLNSTLMRQMQTQSLKVRIQRDPNDAAAKLKLAALADASQRSTVPDIRAMLHHLHRPSDPNSRDGPEAQHADHDEDDPDYIMPIARDAESVVGSVIGSDMGSDVDMGSASEVEPDDFDDDFVDLGGVLEDQEDNQHADALEADVSVPPHDPLDESEEEHDSDKENAPLPASQQSHRSQASPDPAHSLLPSRAVMDEDEDELPGPRINTRRGRRSALADDDAEGQADQSSLQPGPFEAIIHGEDVAAQATSSSDRARIPLADISSQIVDPSMVLSRSNTTSPVAQHAQLPTTIEAEERDPLIFSPTAGDDMDESFRTDDIPSQAADLGRFFESTMPSSTANKPNPLASQPPRKSFWDETQTQTQSQDQGARASHLSAAAGRPHANEVARVMARDPSGNSALEAFFNATQDEELRGESLDIFANPKTAQAEAHGLTALFNDGRPSPFGHSQASAEPPKLSAGARDASSMPPPKSTEVDAFAALRKAQMGAAMELLDPTPSALPSFDESQAERDAYAQLQRGGSSAHVSPEKMYMNRDGFFTQTTPSQRPGFWSQYDTQSSRRAKILRQAKETAPSLMLPGSVLCLATLRVEAARAVSSAPNWARRTCWRTRRSRTSLYSSSDFAAVAQGFYKQQRRMPTLATMPTSAAAHLPVSQRADLATLSRSCSVARCRPKRTIRPSETRSASLPSSRARQKSRKMRISASRSAAMAAGSRASLRTRMAATRAKTRTRMTKRTRMRKTCKSWSTTNATSTRRRRTRWHARASAKTWRRGTARISRSTKRRSRAATAIEEVAARSQ